MQLSRRLGISGGLDAYANGQLPSDCPGVILVGNESLGNNSVDELRHMINAMD